MGAALVIKQHQDLQFLLYHRAMAALPIDVDRAGRTPFRTHGRGPAEAAFPVTSRVLMMGRALGYARACRPEANRELIVDQDIGRPHARCRARRRAEPPNPARKAASRRRQAAPSRWRVGSLGRSAQPAEDYA